MFVFNNKIIDVFVLSTFKSLKSMNLNKHNHFTLRITQIFTQLLIKPIKTVEVKLK